MFEPLCSAHSSPHHLYLVVHTKLGMQKTQIYTFCRSFITGPIHMLITNIFFLPLLKVRNLEQQNSNCFKFKHFYDYFCLNLEISSCNLHQLHQVKKQISKWNSQNAYALPDSHDSQYILSYLLESSSQQFCLSCSLETV